MASEVAYLNGERFRPAVARLLWNCDDLRCYLANNVDSLIDCGVRYRSTHSISTSRAAICNGGMIPPLAGHSHLARQVQ